MAFAGDRLDTIDSDNIVRQFLRHDWNQTFHIRNVVALPKFRQFRLGIFIHHRLFYRTCSAPLQHVPLFLLVDAKPSSLNNPELTNNFLCFQGTNQSLKSIK